MSERFTDDDLPSGESPKEKRWVKPPLVPRSLDLLRDSKETPPPPPPPALLEQVLSKDIKEFLGKQEDDKNDEEEAAEESSDAPATSEESADEVTAEEAPDESVLHIRREPPVSGEQAAATEDEDELRRAYASGGSGSSSTPPPPPPPSVPSPTPGLPNQGPPMFNFNMTPPAPGSTINRYNTVSSPQISVEQHKAALKETEHDSEKRGLRRGLVAGFITGYVLKAYLAGRKRERYEKATEKQLSQRDEQLTQLQREQQRLTEQMAARVEEYKQRQEAVAGSYSARMEGAGQRPNAEALQQAEKYEGEQLFDQEGNEIILQPGWRVERSAGGYSVVLDEHNRVVHDAIRYGEAFKREQKREQLSDDLFAAVGGSTAVPAPSDSQFVVSQSSQQGHYAQQSGGVLPSPERREVDLKHRLPEPRNQLMATVTSPWIWTAVAILIIIYFIAALA